MILSNNGLLNRTSQAKEEHQKQTATEIMNLKITNIQISSYTENQQLPNLQYVSDKLCEDNDMEYVVLKEKEQASLEKITVGSTDSILTKLKEYPYVFEINNQLQLASIDGVKVATTQSINENSVILTKNEYQNILDRLNSLESTVDVLQTNSTSNISLLKRDYLATTAFNADSSRTVESIALNNYGAGKAIISFSVRGYNTHVEYISAWIAKGNNWVAFDADSVNTIASQTNAGCSLNATIDYDENTVINLGIYTSNALTPYYSYSILIIPNNN